MPKIHLADLQRDNCERNMKKIISDTGAVRFWYIPLCRPEGAAGIECLAGPDLFFHEGIIRQREAKHGGGDETRQLRPHEQKALSGRQRARNSSTIFSSVRGPRLRTDGRSSVALASRYSRLGEKVSRFRISSR